MDTHQRLAAKTLRSLKPVGVIQELYGLLIAHFIIRYLMHEAAFLKKRPEHYQWPQPEISFREAVVVI
jgi:hypothetical protein